MKEHPVLLKDFYESSSGFPYTFMNKTIFYSRYHIIYLLFYVQVEITSVWLSL